MKSRLLKRDADDVAFRSVFLLDGVNFCTFRRGMYVPHAFSYMYVCVFLVLYTEG